VKISVIGCGYLGAVHAACMATLGHEVVGIDVDEAKIAALAAGRAPFFEPGLPEVLQQGMAGGKLSFATDIAAAAGADVHFIGVGTPQAPGELRADLQYVDAAVAGLLPLLRPGDVVVGKSTVPVGTAERLAAQFAAVGAVLIWNPEFLREGFAVADTLHPDRIVYGLPTDDHGVATAAALRAKDRLDEVYAVPLAEGIPLVVTDLATAQLVKVAANSFLATKISFINAMAELCEAAGADVTQLADAIGYDSRIGRRFLNAGLGFGGGCLPKDIRAFMARADELGVSAALTFLREVDLINTRCQERIVRRANELCGGSLAGCRVAVLGASFKPDSDDIRNSPALAVATALAAAGAHVVVTDPEAIDNARARHPELDYAPTAPAAAAGADVVVLATEWSQFRALDPEQLGAVVAQRAIIDGRNVLDPGTWRAAGWQYRGMGR